MESRGYGRPGATRLPQPAWRARDHAAVAAAVLLVAVAVLWL
jgi:energy-coupling factor transporter transmembrane protein EcfT